MKKIMSLFLSVCCISVLFAQPAVHSFSFIPKVGVTSNELTGEDVYVVYASTLRNYGFWQDSPSYVGSYYSSVNSERKTGWMAGLDCQYQVSKQLGLVLGVNYARLNFELDASNLDNYEPKFSELSVSYHYIQIPLLAKFYLYKGFAVQTGFQFDIATKGKSHVEGSYLDIPIHSAFSEVNTSDGECLVMVALPDDPKKVVFSVPVGVSYEYKHVIASASYSIPCTRSCDRDENKLYNSAFQFSVGYRFELK